MDTIIIQHSIILSLIETALYWCLQPDEIFGFIGDWLDAMLTNLNLEWLKKPLFACNVCMGGLYSLILYPVLWQIEWEMLPTILCTIGANVLVACLLTRIEG